MASDGSMQHFNNEINQRNISGEGIKYENGVHTFKESNFITNPSQSARNNTAGVESDVHKNELFSSKEAMKGLTNNLNTLNERDKIANGDVHGNVVAKGFKEVDLNGKKRRSISEGHDEDVPYGSKGQCVGSPPVKPPEGYCSECDTPASRLSRKTMTSKRRHSHPRCSLKLSPIRTSKENIRRISTLPPEEESVGKKPPTSGYNDSNSTLLHSRYKSESSSKEELSSSGASGNFCKNYTRKQQLTLCSLCLVEFTTFLGMSIMAPFFPMEAGLKGMDEALIGFVFSNYALVMFLLSPIFGKFLPVIGSKFLFLSGLFLAGGCTILFGLLDELSGTTFVVFCFVVRSFEALGAAAYNTASCTMVADIFPDNLGAVFGLLETFVGLGMTVGPALGGFLYAASGYKLPFFLLGGFMILMVPVNMWLLPQQTSSSIRVKSGSTSRLLKLPSVLVMILVVVMIASAWSFLDPFLEPHLSQFELSTEMVGLIFLMLSAMYGIFSPVWGWVADRWNHTSIMMIMGLLVSAFSLLLLGPADFLPFLENELWLNIVALIILGVAVALALIPTFQSLMDYAIDAGFDDDISTYSLVSGVWSSAYSLGDFVGPSLGGILVKDYGFAFASSTVAGLICLAAAVLFMFEVVLWSKKSKPETEKSESAKLFEKPPDYTFSETTHILKVENARRSNYATV